jgi:hypothetical protein
MLELFLPQKVNNTFIIKEKIIILHVTEASFHAMLLHSTGLSRYILKEFHFEFENKSNWIDQTFLSSLITKSIIGWDATSVKIILPATTSLFKIITSPFPDIEKVRMTIPFELEAALPFQLSEVAIDAIYLSKERNTTKNSVLAIITKDSYINLWRDIFESLPLKIKAISIDTVDFITYFLYYFTPSEKEYFFITGDNTVAQGIYIKDHEVKNSMTITLKKLSLKENKSSRSSLEALEFFSKENNFSLEIIAIFYGKDENDTLVWLLDKQENKNCLPISFDDGNKEVKTISPQGKIDFKKSLFTKLFYQNQHFNLDYKEANTLKNILLFKQIIFAAILIFSLFFSSIIYHIVGIYKMNSTITSSEQKLTKKVKEEFSLQAREANTLDKAIKSAKKNLEESNRSLPIPVCYKKNIFIDLFNDLSVSLPEEEKIHIGQIQWKLGGDETNSTLSLQGRAENFPALHQLEEALKAIPYVEGVTQQQELNFNIHLTVKKNERIEDA